MLLLHPGFFFWKQQGFMTECKGKVSQVFYQADTDATCFCLAFHYSTLGKLTRNKWTHLFQPNWWCSWSMLLAISLISFVHYKSGKVDLLCQQLLWCYSKKEWYLVCQCLYHYHVCLHHYHGAVLMTAKHFCFFSLQQYKVCILVKPRKRNGCFTLLSNKLIWNIPLVFSRCLSICCSIVQ